MAPSHATVIYGRSSPDWLIVTVCGGPLQHNERMRFMRTIVFAALGIICLPGCATIRNQVVMADLRPPAQSFLVDRTPTDSYPGFMVGEGNIYSCRYGIHHQSSREFEPPKDQILAALLVQFLPEISRHEVLLHRFDVYFNDRPKALRLGHAAGAAAVTGAGAAAGTHFIVPDNTDEVNNNVATFDQILIDPDPETTRHQAGKQVGCANAKEGEYYALEISGEHEVVVTWLKFEVNGTPYHYRTFYQFQPSGKLEVSAGIAEAIRLTVEVAAQRIVLP